MCNRCFPIDKYKKMKYKNKSGEMKICFDSKCKDCRSKLGGCEFTLNDTITDDEIINIYEECLQGKRKIFPAFIKIIRPDCWIIIMKYLFKIKLNCNTKIDICNNFNGKTLKKYKICGYEKNGKMMELIKLIYPEYEIYPWELKYGNIHGMYDSEDNRRECIRWFLDKLKEDNIINNDIDILKRDDVYKLFQKYSINGLLIKFNKSSVKALMWYFNKFTIYNINEWDFYAFPRSFWNKENSIRAFKWILSEMKFNFCWNEFKKKDFLLKKIDKNTFKEYNISGAYNYFGNIYEICRATFNKELFYQWELQYTPSNYWASSENRQLALLQLINVLNLSDNEIPICLKQVLLKDTIYNKFNNICHTYYGGNYYYWINEIFPNKFKEKDFKLNKSRDGSIMASRQELIVYEFIKYELKLPIKYIGNKKIKKYFYKCDNGGIRPDFVVILNNKPVIVEYFGLYQSNPQNKITINYKQKTISKIKFFKENNINFIDLYPNDLCYNFKGVKEKVIEFSESGCNLF